MPLKIKGKFGSTARLVFAKSQPPLTLKASDGSRLRMALRVPILKMLALTDEDGAALSEDGALLVGLAPDPLA